MLQSLLPHKCKLVQNKWQQPGAVKGLGQVIADDIRVIRVNLGTEDQSRHLCIPATSHVDCNKEAIEYAPQ